MSRKRHAFRGIRNRMFFLPQFDFSCQPIVGVEGYCYTWPHSMTRTYAAGIFCMRDWLVAEASTWQGTLFRRERPPCFRRDPKPVIPTSERMETMFYSRATGIDKNRVVRKIRRGQRTMFNEELHEYILHQIVKRWSNQIR